MYSDWLFSLSVESLDDMIVCKDLMLCDALVAKKSLNNFERKPVSMILLPCEELFDQRRTSNRHRKLNKTYLSFDKLYRETIESGFEFLPDNFSVFGLFNQTAKLIKLRINPFSFPLGIVDNIPGNMQSVYNEGNFVRFRESATWNGYFCKPFVLTNCKVSPRHQLGVTISMRETARSSIVISGGGDNG